MPRKTKSEDGAENPSTKKGRLLERLVADLYGLPDVTVETNVRMLVPAEEGRTREIDVLVSGSLAGHVIRIPIECKNYRRRIGVEEIDAFAGKLADLRLPGPGVYVSTIGFSKGALERAEKASIRPLLLSGLVNGRLASAVIEVVRSTVYLLLRITEISVQNELPHVEDFGALHVFYEPDGELAGATTDIVWVDWMNGRLPDAIGKHSYDIAIPPEWHQRIDGVISRPKKISISFQVVGLVVSLRGQGTRHALHDPKTGLPEKLRAEWALENPGSPVPVLSFETEETLHEYLGSRVGAIRVTTGRVRLPRIQSGPAYWPPSDRVARTVAALHEAFLAGKAPDPSDLSRMDLEGPDLSTIFEPIWSAQRILPDGTIRPARMPGGALTPSGKTREEPTGSASEVAGASAEAPEESS